MDCFVPEGHDTPEYEAHDGKFYYNNKFHKMQSGDAIIFNDDEIHAWICNAFWIFATIPMDEDYVKSLPKEFVGEILKDSPPTVH